MIRTQIQPRQNWSAEVEKLGFTFYKGDSVPYWQEGAYYEFQKTEIDKIEAAANTVHGLCLQTVERIINERLYPFLGISPEIGKLIEKSWKRKDVSLYGRFDFLYDGSGSPKLLEYNADTPGALFEAAIVQWNWQEQVFPKASQFNQIHTSLVDRWKQFLVGRWIDDGRGNNIANRIRMTAATPNAEDECTTQYIAATAIGGGFNATFLPIQNIGWNGTNYTDMDDSPIYQFFKLYPWEYLTNEQLEEITNTIDTVMWIEPIWKFLLSNKGLLPILWDTFPEHENLLPAYREPGKFGDTRYVAKPMLGRQGANITIREGSKIIEATQGVGGLDYSSGLYIYQGFSDGAVFDGARPNLGVWMVNDKACGMGIREDNKLIVGGDSRFVPHIFN